MKRLSPSGFFLFLFLISFYTIRAQEWEKNADKKGIQVYTRLVKGNKLKDTKSVMTIHCSMDRFLKAQLDFPNYPTWVTKCSSAMLLKKISDLKSNFEIPNPKSNPGYSSLKKTL